MPATQQRKTIPKIVTQCKTGIVKQTDTSTVFRVLGVPYGGPEYLEGKDLHGEYFDKTTDFGWDPTIAADAPRVPVIARGLSFYDHAFHPKFGTEPIGVAKFYAETDDGQWWDIEVRRAYQYHDFLLTLAQKDMLGASSQPIQTSVEIDYDWGEGTGDGKIKRWHTVEVSLTPTPANPLAVVEVAKSFEGMFDEDALKQLGRKRTKVKTVVVNAEVPEFEEEDEDDESLEQVVAQVFAEEPDEDTAEAEIVDDAPTEEVGTVPDDVKALRADVTALIDAVASLTDLVSKAFEADVDRTSKLHRTVTELNTGMKAFAKSVAEGLRERVRVDALEMSEAERSAVVLLQEAAARSKTGSKPARLSSGIPNGVPGK